MQPGTWGRRLAQTLAHPPPSVDRRQLTVQQGPGGITVFLIIYEERPTTEEIPEEIRSTEYQADSRGILGSSIVVIEVS